MLYPHEIVDPVTRRVLVTSCKRTATRAGQCGCGGGCSLPACPCTDPACINWNVQAGEIRLEEFPDGSVTETGSTQSAPCCAQRPQPQQGVPIAVKVRVRSRLFRPASPGEACPRIITVDLEGEGIIQPPAGPGITVTQTTFQQFATFGGGCSQSTEERSFEQGAAGCNAPPFLGDGFPEGEPPGPRHSVSVTRFRRGLTEFVWAGTGGVGGVGGGPVTRFWVAGRNTMAHLPWCTGTAEVGACCCGGECLDCHTEGACRAARGRWLGAGSNCLDKPCAAPGRCCIPGVGCAELDEDQCADVGGIFSALLDCSWPCGWACCHPPASGLGCTETGTAEECVGTGGIWKEFETCQSAVCPGTGACCYSQLGTPACNQMSAAECQSHNGTWFFGQACEKVCPVCPHTACCWTECLPHLPCHRVCAQDVPVSECAARPEGVFLNGFVCGEPTAECPGVVCGGRDARGAGRAPVLLPRRRARGRIRVASGREVLRFGSGGGGGSGGGTVGGAGCGAPCGEGAGI